MSTTYDQRAMETVKARLVAPTDDEYNRVTARWLFGKHGDKMLAHAPFSFILTKLMWRKGEEPWAK